MGMWTITLFYKKYSFKQVFSGYVVVGMGSGLDV